MLNYIRWIWRNTIGIRLNIAAQIMLGLLNVACALAMVWLSKMFIDETIRTGTDSDIWTMVALLIGTVVAGIVLRQICYYLGVKAKVRQSNGIRLRIYDRLMHRRLFDGKPLHSSEMVTRLEQDIDKVSDSIATMLPDVAIGGCKLLGAFLLLRTMDTTLAWLLVLITPILIVVGKLLARRLRSLTHDIRQQESRVQTLIQESLELDTTLRTLGTTPWIVGQVDGLQEDLEGKVQRRNKFTVISRTIMAASFGLGYLTAFIWGGLQLRSGAITIGVMTSFLQLVSQIQQPILALLNLVPQFIHATASIDRLNELETLELESANGDAPITPLQKPGIRFENVTFRYTDEGGDVLRNFSRDIPPCSRTAIIGRTGAGKTTVFRMLLGLITPQEGSVSLYEAGNDANTIAASPATRTNFVFVPQGNTLMSGTIRYNLCLANPDATDAQLKEALHIAAADFVMDFPDGLDTEIAERGSGLSEGQAQRIAIARGILREGSIMLLDEISSSLDENTERELFTRLFARCKDKTILMITHRPAVAELCDAVWRV
ncbi:MAG: ABC transporter ATP-binding protein [Bacteroidales bacterium]|nr:ABC transporter ATP-binding protein [Bacteroidales bacterium]